MSLYEPRLFTVAEANAFVPKLNEIFTAVRDDLASARKVASELAKRGYAVDPEKEVRVDPKAPKEIRAMQAEVRDTSRRILDQMAHLTESNVEVKALDGLCDFRSRRHGEVVYLCWRYPEARIETWHTLASGFAGRQPLDAPEEFEGDLLQ